VLYLKAPLHSVSTPNSLLVGISDTALRLMDSELGLRSYTVPCDCPALFELTLRCQPPMTNPRLA
jgi:hypothetical protein